MPNTVVYTGTHDNNTTRGWYEGLPHDRQQKLRRHLEIPDVESTAGTEALLKLAWFSPAVLWLAPLQDLLNLGAEARMNVPRTPKGRRAALDEGECFPRWLSIDCET